MKKIYLFILAVFLLVMNGLSQVVTVTNPTSTTPNLAATYGSLAAAVTALNGITTISGPVVITLNAGNNQTAPVGGYVIQFAATTTAANNITIQGSGNTITASAGLTIGAINDAIFKLIGADHITLSGFIMQENPANNTTGGASPQNGVTGNNMTEWGIALLHASVTNGSQNNTIQNNTISLNRSYRNTFGIYSNVNHSATVVTGSELITSLAGSNFGNKVYSNTISNVGLGIVFVGASNSAFMDTGNDIGGSSAATGNTITNWGATSATLSNYVFVTTSSYCIYVNHQTNENVSYNTLTSALISNTTLPMGGIFKTFGAGAPSGTITSTITNNTITVSSLDATSTMHAISNNTVAPASTTFSLTISNNSIINCNITGAGSTSSFTGIINTSAIGAITFTNNVIRGTASTAATGSFTGILNSGAVINTVNINNNVIGNAAGGAATFSVATTGAISGISNTGAAVTATVNINNNSLDGFSFVNCGTVNLIQNSAGSAAAVNINDNQLGTTTGSLISFSGVQANALSGIINSSGNAAMAVSIQNNDFRGIVNTATGTGSQQYINSQAPVLSSIISNNTFTGLSINSSATVYLILKGGIMAAGTSSVVSNNSIVGTFAKTASGGVVYGYISGPASVNGSTITISDNNFSNVSLAGTGTFIGISDGEGTSVASGPTKTITGNVFNNIASGSGAITLIATDKGAAVNCSSNTFSNISSSGGLTGIFIGTNNGQGNIDCTSNSFTGLSSSGGSITTISANCPSVPLLNISSNTINGLTSAGAGAQLTGISITSALAVNINDNLIHNVSGTGTGSAFATGIALFGGTTVNIYKNKVYNFQETGTGAGAPLINGIRITDGTTVTVYNNFVSDLRATNLSHTRAVSGIVISSTTASTTYNLYYNSVYLNASSSGVNFGTAGIYHVDNASSTTGALTMINNIVVNMSTPNGAGEAVAYYVNGTTLANYTGASDHNLFYAGTPGPQHLIFYDGTNSDQTLAAYKARVSPRDANSVSLMPNFVSATDLHLTAANCRINGRGIPVAGITDDIDLNARNATTPDIGADEFTAGSSTTLAGVAATAVCEDRTVEATGTTYKTNICDLIARIVPSGGDPVAGNINACVTLDAAQQYFNGEPYVQRHYDLEPVTSNQSTTSATITLYFTNAEFVQYNTNNPVWPKLPTIAGGGMADPFLPNVKVTQFHGTPTGGLPTSTPGNYTGTRILLTPTSIVLNGTTWEVTVNVAGFSGFYVHTNMWNAPLPVSVNYFTGIKQGSSHLLNWKVTCNSTPRVTMQLERSADSRNFTGINSITADAARCNHPFNHTDADPLNGMNYYRLKMTDVDGKISYSSIVALLNATKGFDIISLASNPVVNDHFKLNIASAQAGKMEILIYDMQGRLVHSESRSLIAGFNSPIIQVGKLARGIYTLQGNMSAERAKPMQFVKQ